MRKLFEYLWRAAKRPPAVGALIVFAYATLIAPRAARAQFPDLADASAQYLPGVALEEPRPARAQVSTYDASLNLPVILGEKTFLIPGVAYHVDAVSFSNTPPNFTELRAFHAVDVSVLFVQLLPHDWALSLRAAPGVASDMQGFEWEKLHISGLALATHEFSKDFVFGGGALANFSFGSLLPLPALYLDWRPFGGAQIETFLPAFATAKYTIANRVELGVRADINGNAYAIHDARIADTWPCAARPDDSSTPQDEARPAPAQCFDHVAYSVGTFGVVTGVRLFESVWWTAFAGRTFFRRFEQLNDHDKRLPGGLQTLPQEFFVRTGLTWRIPRD